MFLLTVTSIEEQVEDNMLSINNSRIDIYYTTLYYTKYITVDQIEIEKRQESQFLLQQQ